MDDMGNGIEIIRGDGMAEPSKAEELLKKLLGDENIKTDGFFKEPGGIINPHYHTENLAAYVLKGKIRIQTGKDLSNVLDLSPGDAILMKKGTVHREEVIGEEPCEMTKGYIKDFETVQVDS